MSCSCGKCNETIKLCKQTSIPQVDNSALECGESGFVNFNCVVKPEAVSYLSLPENSSLEEVFQALLNSLIDARNRIEILEN